MNIMVFDVPAESGGALSVLNDFYNEVVNNDDKSVNWIFVLSIPTLKEASNIKVLRFPWIKKSWGHRYFFDQVIAPKLIKHHNVDKIFSLQNITIPRVKCEQVLYVHQSLPFVDDKFSFMEEKKLWFYQNIIGRMIIYSIKNADKVIVQTNWMKKECTEKSNVYSEKIAVVRPKSKIEVKSVFRINNEPMSTFFYPANSSIYKNHRVIIEACKILNEKRLPPYRVILTIDENENHNIAELSKIVKDNNLPVEFIGKISREHVFEYYSKSILLFPSFIESSPLPLTEARMHGTIILTSNRSYSHEVLDGYKNAYTFDPFNSNELANIMKKIITREIKYIQCDDTLSESYEDGSSILDFLK